MAVICVIAPACDDDGGTAPEQLPEELSLNGTAQVETSDARVTCGVSARIRVDSTTADGWSGTVLSGEVVRTVTRDPDGSQFQAAVAGPASLVEGDGAVELSWVGDQSGGSPFWMALEVMTGRRVDVRSYEGGWTCAPLDIDSGSFVDTTGVAPGSWRLTPVADDAPTAGR